MTTTWVIYKDVTPYMEVLATPQTVDALLADLRRLDPRFCWDAYAQKWGDWFDD